MLGFRKLAVVQAKLYLREPLNVFFTLALGPLLLVLLGLIFGNKPDPMLGGLAYLDIATPAYMAVIIVLVGLAAVPISSATRREMGVLRRFSATPLRPLTYFLADVLVPYGMSLLGILLLVLVARVGYGVRSGGSLLSLLAAVSLGAFAFLALGYALLGLVPGSRAVTLIGNVLLYVLMFFSGAMVPLEVMPETVRRFARFLPLTHLVALLRGLWAGAPWGTLMTETAVLAGLTAVGMVVVARTFRWE